MKIFITAVIFILLLAEASGQNLIGYNYDEIRDHMRTNHRNMLYNKVTNSKFNYLKYSDNTENQTILFFLDSDSVCRSIRMICDETARAQRIKEFNSLYKKRGENRWIDTREGNNYFIELKDEDWASVITVLPTK